MLVRRMGRIEIVRSGLYPAAVTYSGGAAGGLLSRQLIGNNVSGYRAGSVAQPSIMLVQCLIELDSAFVGQHLDCTGL